MTRFHSLSLSLSLSLQPKKTKRELKFSGAPLNLSGSPQRPSSETASTSSSGGHHGTGKSPKSPRGRFFGSHSPSIITPLSRASSRNRDGDGRGRESEAKTRDVDIKSTKGGQYSVTAKDASVLDRIAHKALKRHARVLQPHEVIVFCAGQNHNELSPLSFFPSLSLFVCLCLFMSLFICLSVSLSLSRSLLQVFVELEELRAGGDGTDHAFMEWEETARWIKFEEDVEQDAGRWGRPHVSALAFHSLVDLRKSLENGTTRQA